MTLKEFDKLCENNNIPEDAELIGDSGWECDGTQVEAVFYDSTNNLLILTQEGNNHAGTFNCCYHDYAKRMDIRYAKPKRLK